MSSHAISSLAPSRIAARLGMCAIALASTFGAMTEASADVITFNTPIAVPANIDGIYLNLLTGANGTTGSSTAGWDFNPYLSSSGLGFFWPSTPAASFGGVASTTTGPYLDLTNGMTVSSASIFSTTLGATPTTAFRVTGDHILGFRFFNESTSAINYGYVTLTSGSTTGFPLTITGWSFDNTGAAITVATAPVPEASSAMMLSLGGLLLGAVALRRQRRS